MTSFPVLASRIRPLLLLAPLFSLPAEALTLANDQWRIELDPATLAAEAVLPSGKHLVHPAPARVSRSLHCSRRGSVPAG